MTRPLRILHYTAVYAPAWKWGGPVQSTARLCEGLAALGHHVEVMTTNAGLEEDPAIPTDKPVDRNGVRVRYHPILRGPGVRSPGLQDEVRLRVEEFDVVHVTGVWQTTSVAACRAAERAGVPYVVSPRGALGAYSWTQKRWKKLPYWWLFEARNCRRAAAVHYTSRMEVEECARLRLPGRVILLPNSIGLDRFVRNVAAGQAWRARYGIAPDAFLFLNCGRRHHKKGLDLLPGPLAALPREVPWRFVFMGMREDGTQDLLEAEFRRLGLADRVTFLDVMPPEDVVAAYSTCDAFVLPSRHENFGNVVAEAMACGAPVVMSDQVGAYDQLDDLPLAEVLPLDPARWEASFRRRVAAPRPGEDVRAQVAGVLRERFGQRELAAKMAGEYAKLVAVRRR